MRNTLRLLSMVLMATGVLVVGASALAVEEPRPVNLPPSEGLYSSHSLNAEPGPVSLLPDPGRPRIEVDPPTTPPTPLGAQAATGGALRVGKGGGQSFGNLGGGALPGGGVGLATVDRIVESERDMRRLIRRLAD